MIDCGCPSATCADTLCTYRTKSNFTVIAMAWLRYLSVRFLTEHFRTSHKTKNTDAI